MSNKMKHSLYAGWHEYHGTEMEDLLNFAGDHCIDANYVITLLEHPMDYNNYENVRGFLRQVCKASKARMKREANHPDNKIVVTDVGVRESDDKYFNDAKTRIHEIEKEYYIDVHTPINEENALMILQKGRVKRMANNKRLFLSLSEEDIQKLDVLREELAMNRSQYIRYVISGQTKVLNPFIKYKELVKQLAQNDLHLRSQPFCHLKNKVLLKRKIAP